MGLFSGITKAIGGVFGGGDSYDTSGQERAAAESSALQKRMYEEGLERVKPYEEAGGLGLSRLQQYMGLAGDETAEGYGSLMGGYEQADLYRDPSYQFRLGEGEKAIERAMAARGKTFSPEAVRALSDYGQQSASQEYANALARSEAMNTNQYNRLMGITGLGQSATGQSNALGGNYANAVQGITTGLADAQAAAHQAQASERASMFGNLLGAGATILGGPVGGALSSRIFKG